MSDEQVTDANEEVSSEPQIEESDAGSEVSTETEPQAAPPENVPFHEDPKVQEYVQRQIQKQMDEQKAYYDQQLQLRDTQIKQFSQTQRPIEAKPAPYSELVQQLKGHNPEFGNWVEQQSQLAEQVKQIHEQQLNQRFEQTRTQAYSEVARLHTQYEVPDELKSVYEAQVEKLAFANPNITMNDLPKVYEKVHENMKSMIETIRRHERESYVKDKTKDAKIPTNKRGEPVSPGQKPKWSTDPDTRRNELVARVLKTSREENDI